MVAARTGASSWPRATNSAWRAASRATSPASLSWPAAKAAAGVSRPWLMAAGAGVGLDDLDVDRTHPARFDGEAAAAGPHDVVDVAVGAARHPVADGDGWRRPRPRRTSGRAAAPDRAARARANHSSLRNRAIRPIMVHDRPGRRGPSPARAGPALGGVLRLRLRRRRRLGGRLRPPGAAPGRRDGLVLGRGRRPRSAPGARAGPRRTPAPGPVAGGAGVGAVGRPHVRDAPGALDGGAGGLRRGPGRPPGGVRRGAGRPLPAGHGPGVGVGR